MAIAVQKANNEIDVYLDDGGGFTLPLSDFTNIRKSFSEHKMLANFLIKPTSVINYLDETNPYLLDAEINIENEKIRRKMANSAYDFAKIALPFIMVIIGGVIAWKMLMSGDVSSANQISSVVPNMAPVVIK
ncbi:MAG: hypothetical protein KAW93_06410 [Methanogenium sp.]|nr:hypothetical protein [Methanogenium sp.]